MPPKGNPGSSEAGGAMVDCIRYLFLSFATVVGIKINFQAELPVLIQGPNIINSQGKRLVFGDSKI